MRVDLQINNAQIDLYDFTDFPIALTFSLIDIQEFDKRKSAFSKTIRVPATETNSEAFGFQYSANIDTTNTRQFDFNLYAEGLKQMSGKAMVTACGVLSDPDYFEITLYSGIKNWAEDLKTKKVNTYNLGTATHEIGSVDNTIYPDRNYVYCPFNKGEWLKNISVNEDDVTPSIFIKAITEQIFTDLGYNVNSDFFDTAYFRSLVYQTFGEQTQLTDAQREAREFDAEKATEQTIALSGRVTARLTFQQFKTLNSSGADISYNTTNSVVTIDKSGYYQFNTTLLWDMDLGSALDESVYYQAFLNKNGTRLNMTIDNSTKRIIPNNSAPITYTDVWLSDLIYLEVGDQLYIETIARSNFKFASISELRWQAGSTFSTEYISPKFGKGNTYDLASVIRDETLAFDLIKDLQVLFNLLIDTDEDRKEITIEPRDDYFLGKGNAIDWTNKLDHSREIIDTYLSDDTVRKWEFKYKVDDNDKRLEFNNKGREILYFDDQYEFPEYFVNEINEIELRLFSPSWEKQDWKIDATDSTTPTDWPRVPMAWNREESEVSWKYPPQALEFAPRILYFNGWNTDYSVRFSNPGGDTTTTNKALPQLQFYTIPDGSLSFSTMIDNGVTYDGLLKRYYSTTFKTLKEGKRRRCYIDLTSKDIAELNFRKPVFIRSKTDNQYWVISKIIDYNPTNKDTTEVELITYFDDAPTEVTNSQTSVLPLTRVRPDLIKDYQGAIGGVSGGLGDTASSFLPFEDGSIGFTKSWEINNNGRHYTKRDSGNVNLASRGGAAVYEEQAILGTYNEINEDALIQVGRGSGADDRKNAWEVVTASGDYGQERYYFKMDGVSVNAWPSRKNALLLTSADSPYTLSGTESWVAFDNSMGGDIEVTLADPDDFKPEIMIVKDEGGSAGGGVTLFAPSGTLIDGANSFVINQNYEYDHFYVANGNYFTT